MCGIAGIIGRLGGENEAALRRMSAAMAHRGPDGEGFWRGRADERGWGCMMAHRRLSILDLSEHGAQPMVDPPTGKVVVFNGEIYNYREIREELAGAGERFESSGDTAVMLRALAMQGYRAVEKFRGMFAFALWDDVLRQLVIGRDPMGIKPLYVCRNTDPEVNGEWAFVFASEVRAILASGLIARPRLNPAAAASVVWNGFVAGPGTAVQGVESVWPGTVRVVGTDGRDVKAERYWEMPRPSEGGSEEEVAEVLRESVRQHLVSDVPVGVFLSAGVDSSAVANLAQRAVGKGERVNTFTLAFEEAELSEGAAARRIAEAIGTNHREITLREEDFVGQMEAAVESLDQPTFDGLNSYFISRAVREAGLKVALIGTGGDELFGGYQSFRHLPTMHRLSRTSAWVPSGAKRAAAVAVAAVAQRSTGAKRKHSRWAKLPDMVEDGEDLVALYQHAYALFLPEFQGELLAEGAKLPLFRGLTRPMYERLRQEISGHDALSAVSVLEGRLFLGERLLRDTDAASMAVSLEVRLPLVDRPLWESASTVTDELRYEPIRRKAMLRRIGLAGLDSSLFERPKSGFVLPFDRWLRQRLGAVMDRTMRDERMAGAAGLNGHTVCRLWDTYRSQDQGGGLYWSRIWALYVFIRWCHRHGVLL